MGYAERLNDGTNRRQKNVGIRALRDTMRMQNKPLTTLLNERQDVKLLGTVPHIKKHRVKRKTIKAPIKVFIYRRKRA